jgi:hypothetical protein
VLNSLGSPASRRVYEYVIDQFIAWYCSEPRLTFNRIVGFGIGCAWNYAACPANAINQQLAAVRRIAHEAADAGLLSPELAAAISRVKGVKQLGFRAGNWLSAAQSSEEVQLRGRTSSPPRAESVHAARNSVSRRHTMPPRTTRRLTENTTSAIRGSRSCLGDSCPKGNAASRSCADRGRTKAEVLSVPSPKFLAGMDAIGGKGPNSRGSLRHQSDPPRHNTARLEAHFSSS